MPLGIGSTKLKGPFMGVSSEIVRFVILSKKSIFVKEFLSDTLRFLRQFRWEIAF